MRKAEIARNTAETDITIALNVDGTGKSAVDTGCGFLDHMLALFARHGRFDLEVKCVGDTWVDYHHTAEDMGICLGKAFDQALKDRRGIVRYGSAAIPMDETLVLCAVDISGRCHLEYALEIKAEKVGDFDTELVNEFFCAFVRSAEITLHLRQLSGSNAHHIIEGAFKAFARAMSQAAAIEAGFENEIPSTKGVLV